MNTKKLPLIVFAVVAAISLQAQNTFPSSGNVGIGTSSPLAQMHVADIYPSGGKNLQIGDDTFFSDVDIANTLGLYGSQNSDRGALILGSAGPLLFGLTGNLGIGTTTPSSKLHIVGAGGASVDLVVNGRISTGDGSNAGGMWVSTANNLFMGQAGTNSLGLYNNGAWRLIADNGGKIGIGTTTPTTNLTVNGTGTVEANIATDGASTSRSILSFSRNTGTWNVGMNMNLANSDNFYFRYNGTYPFTIQSNGNVGIGTTNPNQKLTVNGTIYGKEVKVDLSVPGPDYVFSNNYQLLTINELKAYIDQHRHLPEVPSAKEMEANGINLGEMNMMLLRKIEELTLHLIDQNKLVLQLQESSRASADASAKKIEEFTLYVIEQNKIISKQNERISNLESKR